jgi:hypothetical protein
VLLMLLMLLMLLLLKCPLRFVDLQRPLMNYGVGQQCQ